MSVYRVARASEGMVSEWGRASGQVGACELASQQQTSERGGLRQQVRVPEWWAEE